ncbi:DNA-binding protein [Paraburkholderia sp. DGU8]|uniref:DNA-binding protein n=1 Tax=Paraburkholderia sp. DGU8 TaxID=3161997 RepID=UPI0034670D74
MTTIQQHTPVPLTTEALAGMLGLKVQTLRKRFCQTGSYFGLVPMKLPNGRLLWPADSLHQLTGA